MPAAKQLTLTAEEKKNLEAWTKNPPKAYVRRKAWALLLAASGKPAYEVAKDRRVHAHRTTVSHWLERFQTQGLEGLLQSKGQGRKPSFSPSKRSGSPSRR